MKITMVSCKNFKSYENRSFSLTERTAITADNFQGKTSIAEAIVFGLFGCTLSGSPRTDHFTRKGQKKVEVGLAFVMDGQEHVLERVQGSKPEVYLDGQKVTQVDVDAIVGSKDKFLATYWPTFFTSLPEKEGREMVMGLIKPPSQAEVVAQLESVYQQLLTNENLRDPDGRAKEIRQEIKANESEVSRLEGKLEVLRENAKREIPEPIKWDDSELDGLKTKLQSMQSDTASKIKEMRAQLSGMGREYDAFKAQIQDVPEAPYQDGDACPVCAQGMHGDSLHHALQHHEKHAADIKAKNARLVAKCKDIVDTGNAIREQLNALEDSYIAADTNELKTQIAELERKKTDVMAHNAHIGRIRIESAEAKDQVSKVEAEVQSCKDAAFELAETIKAIGAYRAKLAEMQVEQLKKHLNRVDIELFKVTKTTGEVKDCFIVTYDGREFKTLSYSEQIRAGLEISNLFNQVLGKEYPVFVDNAESITHFNTPLCGQLITATVVPGAELSVGENKVEGSVA